MNQVTARVNQTDSALNEVYGYDALSRENSFARTSTSDPADKTWMMDSQGNRYYPNDSYNTDNQVSSSSYNADGDAQTVSIGSGGASSTQIYDAWGRIVSQTTLSLPGDEIGTTTTYTYDAAGREMTATTNGVMTQTFYDLGNNPIEERSGNGTLQTQYVWSGAGTPQIVLRDSNTNGNTNGTLNQRIYALTDGNNSTTAILLDTQMSGQATASWQVVERYAYGADGEPVAYTSIWGLTSTDDVTAGNYNWTILYEGMRWHDLSDGAGLYSFVSGGTGLTRRRTSR